MTLNPINFETVTTYLEQLVEGDYGFGHGFIAALYATDQVDEQLFYKLMDWLETAI